MAGCADLMVRVTGASSPGDEGSSCSLLAHYGAGFELREQRATPNPEGVSPMNKRIAIGAAIAVLAGAALAGCSSQADTVSNNLSQDADSFKIHRDIVVQNGITGAVLYQISGLCSLGNDDSGNKHTLTCKIGSNTYVKELIWLGDQDEVLSVQSSASYSDPYAYRIVVHPVTIDLPLQTAGSH